MRAAVRRGSRLGALALAAALALLPFFAPAAGAAAAARTEFTRAELLADFDFLCATLREDYPFLPVLARRGLDAEALFAETRRQIAAGDAELRFFFAAVRGLLARLENFAHLDVVRPELYAEYRDNGWGGEAAQALLVDPQTARTYALLAEAAPEGAGAAPEIGVDYDEAAAAIFLRVGSFAGALRERDAGVVAAALRRWPEARHIVFDVTGNRGGSDEYWSAVLVAPFGGAPAHTVTNWLRASPVNLRYLGADGMRPLAEWPVAVPEFVAELGLTHFVQVEERLPFGEPARPGIGRGVRRWVLIDGGVYSAADGFAAFCKATGWATLVGAPTAGEGADSFAPFLVRLPHTGLLVRFSTTAAANADGTLNSETGTRPDFPCKPRETPRQACLRRIAAGE